MAHVATKLVTGLAKQLAVMKNNTAEVTIGLPLNKLHAIDNSSKIIL